MTTTDSTTRPLTVAVHGATGSQGLPVVRALLAAGHTVRGLARTPDRLRLVAPGALPVEVDLDDPAGLADAYAGVDAVVVQLPLVFEATATAHAEHVLHALARAGVPRAVANLGGPVPPAPVGHPYVDARVLLRDGLLAGPAGAATVRPALAYADNLALPASARLVLDGTLAYPLPAQAAVPWLAADDLARLVVDLLTIDTLDGADHALAGPDLLDGPAAAAAVADALGRSVAWESISPDAYREMLRPTIGEAAADGIAAMYAAASAGPPPAAPADAPDPLLGTTTLATWAARQDWARLAD